MQFNKVEKLTASPDHFISLLYPDMGDGKILEKLSCEWFCPMNEIYLGSSLSLFSCLSLAVRCRGLCNCQCQWNSIFRPKV